MLQPGPLRYDAKISFAESQACSVALWQRILSALMNRGTLITLACLLCTIVTLAESDNTPDIDQVPHSYRQRTPKDRFTRLKEDFESGRVPLDQSSEKAFVVALLKALEIPATSQMLVFSTTSLQLRLISPSNPRALYFTDDLYLGYVPRGQIEILSLDPELGAIFYIFNIPREGQPPRIERSERCMNCHVNADTQFVPGLVLKSVVPGLRGGSLIAYRQEQIGHSVPFDQRFGGWYVTGMGAFTNHWGNLTGRLSPEGLTKNPIQPGALFDFARYPVASSDLLPQLLLEHQAGFVNRAVEASYKARTFLHSDNGQLTTEHAGELDKAAHQLTRYILFADEAPLPAGGLDGNSDFRADFLRNRRPAADGASFKELDLRTRLLKHRCSYMIYSPVFEGLPGAMKQRVFRELRAGLKDEKRNEEFAYLPVEEKQVIRKVLKETLADLAGDW